MVDYQALAEYVACQWQTVTRQGILRQAGTRRRKAAWQTRCLGPVPAMASTLWSNNYLLYYMYIVT